MNLNYQEKYLKYKDKYFKLRNQIGGSGIKIKSTTGKNKVVDKSWSDGKNENPLTLYSDNPNNPNQTFLMKEYDGKLFIADENNLCISDNGKNDNGSKMIMDICDVNSPDQQFNIRTKLPDNKYIFENKNKDKCLDSSWDTNLTYWACDRTNHNPNQQFQIINSDMNIKDINLDEELVIHQITQLDILNNYKTKTHKEYIDSLNASPYDLIYRSALDTEDANSKKTLVVNFSGAYIDFTILYRVSICKSNIMLIRDKHNMWYHTKLHKIISYINKFIMTNNITKIILIGVSAGGYASLYCANSIDNCICIAMNPQTFPKTKDHPYYIYNENMKNAKFTPKRLFDLRDIFTKKSNNSKKYILVSRADCQDYTTCDEYWHDLVFSGYLMGLPNVVIIFVPINGHAILGYFKADPFYSVCIKQYKQLFDNMIEGKIILNNLEYEKFDRDKDRG